MSEQGIPPSEPSQPAPPPTPLVLGLELDPCINLAMHENGVPLIKRISIENKGPVTLQDLTVRIRAEPAFATPTELRLSSLAPAGTRSWETPQLLLLPAFLAALRERQVGHLEVEVLVGGERALLDRREVSILAYDQWAGIRSLPELLCAFVLPNHPAVAQLLRDAAGMLEVWTKDPALAGYQQKSRDRVLKTAAAIYHAIQTAGITYIVPPASFEKEGQKIRTPDRIAADKLGTCLDLAVLAAACLEQAGLNPLLVVVNGHAFAGVWLDDASFPEPTIDDCALLTKRTELGEIALFDPTAATNRPALGFEQAMAAARARLSKPNDFHCVIDVARARRGGIRPLPIRADGVQLETTLEPSTPEAPTAAPAITAPQAVQDPGAIETPATRIERWKRRLLDLTNRNRLLNYVESKKTIALEFKQLGKLEDELADGTTFTLRAALSEQQAGRDGSPTADSETVKRLVVQEFEADRLVTRFLQAELDARLTTIYRAAREGLEEGGASGLYIALGFLEWFEDKASDQPRRAPLILVPVDVQRGSIRQGFKLTRAADESRFNTTLVEMLRTEHGIEIRGLEELPEDDHGVDVDKVLQQVRSLLRDVPRWRVIEEAALGFFTFAKFLMWKDLDEQADVLIKNHIVSHLVERPNRAFDPDWREPDYAGLDDANKSSTVHCPVLADSSQIAAVLAAANGKSFVLEGPPGTGKSQTITNLIAHCLSQGKTVLFVSEKTAALNVVFDRLRAIGLERFCLELHSNKASKAEVIRQLGESLRGARVRSPQEWDARATELDRVRAELNSYARAISREHPNGLSVFQATSMLTGLREAPCIDLGWEGVGATDRRTLDEIRALAAEARAALMSTGSPRGYRLEGVGIEEVPAGLAARLRSRFQELRARLSELPRKAEPAARLFGIDSETASLADLRSLNAICTAIDAAPSKGAALATRDAALLEPLFRNTCELGRELDALRDELSKQFELRVLKEDLVALRGKAREAAESWFGSRWIRTKALRRSLLGVTQPGLRLGLRELGAGIERAIRFAEMNDALTTRVREIETESGTTWSIDASPWADVEALLAWAISTRTELTKHVRRSDVLQARVTVLANAIAAATDVAALKRDARLAAAAIQEATTSHALVAAELNLSPEDPWLSAEAEGAVPSARARMDLIEPAVGDMQVWALWRRRRSALVAFRLDAFAKGIDAGIVPPTSVVASFERSYLEAWLLWARAQDPALRDFLALSHDQRILRFRDLDERCTNLARKVVEARLSAQVPDGSSPTVPNSELFILRRELEKQRRHMAPRALVQQARKLVQRLKPCLLMSPISVAQYLPPGAITFDLVVFDEASQIPTWDAVGAIARGSQAVVVGDSKQLPPTSFFDVAVQDGELEVDDVEELESILDECRAVGVPALELMWHYRSRHESLITFSNRKYYRNRLSTFPAAKFAGLGVRWQHVPGGVYDKGRSRTNALEARALVNEVLRRLRDPALSRYSIGIVTFSSPQQRKVEDLLDQERRNDSSLDKFFVGGEGQREAIFIKNLENVQGDERDVILFSICYGPDETGVVGMNFGPLNQQGGERRLNVAVTRARRELVVFSTLTADQIDMKRTRARGVADLKTFLDYARRGVEALPAEATLLDEQDAFDSPLEKEICEALRARGHEVHSQVGCSGYRIDLAVVDPTLPGRYLVGIECDGRNYHSAKTARDRDRLRQSVLVGLGWTLLRVWSSDWWEHREVELQRLCKAIEDVRAIAVLPPPPSPPPSGPVSDSSPPISHAVIATSIQSPTAISVAPEPPPAIASGGEASRSYRARRASHLGSQEVFYEPYAVSAIRSELLAIVEAEGPILLELAAARIAPCFGFERARAKLVERVEDVARRAKIPFVKHGEREFLWPATRPAASWAGFRTSHAEDGDARDAVDLPPEEIANAAAHLLAASGACPRPDLQRSLSKLFGFKALGSAVARYIDEGVDLLLNSGRARSDSEGRIRLIS